MSYKSKAKPILKKLVEATKEGKLRWETIGADYFTCGVVDLDTRNGLLTFEKPDGLCLRVNPEDITELVDAIVDYTWDYNAKVVSDLVDKA